MARVSRDGALRSWTTVRQRPHRPFRRVHRQLHLDPGGLRPRAFPEGTPRRQLPVPALGLHDRLPADRPLRRPRGSHRTRRRLLHVTRSRASRTGRIRVRHVQPPRRTHGVRGELEGQYAAADAGHLTAAADQRPKYALPTEARAAWPSPRVRRKLSDGPRRDHRGVLWHRPGDDPGASRARSRGRGHRAAAGDPGRTYPLPSGSLRRFTVQPTVDAAIAAGPFDGLISNADETVRRTVEATPLSEYERLLGLNFLGALRVTKAVLSGFREPSAAGSCRFPDVRPARPPLGATDKTCCRTDIVVSFH